MTFEQFALVWPLIAIPLVAATVIAATRMLERLEERRHRQAAE
jgi:hypothetical protein